MIRTGYSFRVAFGHLEDVMSRLVDIGSEIAPICDRSSTFGFNRWTKLAKKAGLRPIYGVEIGVVTALGDKKPVVDYFKFFAKDNIRDLHDLIALATGHPGKEPSITYKEAFAAKGLLKIAGERVNLELASPGKKQKDFFIGLSPATPKGLFREAKAKGFKFLATSDNVFPRAEDKELYRVALGRRSFTQTYPQHILEPQEWAESVSAIADHADVALAQKNTRAATKTCVATMKRATLLTPAKPKSLKAMCIEGARRLGVSLKDPIYKERLERELRLIAEKEFEDYFYIISDMIAWAKKRMIVGPARGSSCGSLACYLLGITTVDPIPYGLIFERFIDTTRKDLPDVDIDFSDTNRQLVFDYMEKTYGEDHVARLGTVGLFKPRSALKQAALGLRIPQWQVEKVLDGLIERSGGDSRALQALEDTLTDTEAGRKMLDQFPEVKIAGRMEGHPNNASQHAAGIVLTQEPIAEYVAIDARTKAAMCDKKDAEDLNLLKIDALGLTQLSIFERTLELIGEKPVNGFLEKLPLDDPKAFEVLNDRKFAGIFQFTGLALQSLTRQVRIESLDDMVSITALARPGPMATGGANAWAKRRMGLEKIEHITKLMEDLTKDTYGIVIYQETVMNIVRTIGMMSWEDTSAIRKAMSGRLGDEFFEGYWLKFRKGALANGISESIAKAIWDQVNTFGSWAFNKSHAVAYGMVSYYCCWLKAHHALEFAAASLDAETDPIRQIQMLRELRDEGIEYRAVDPEFSTDRWEIMTKDGKKMLVGPLTSIKGIGPATVNEILTARKRKEPIRAALLKRLGGAKTDIDTLFPIRDAVRRAYPDLSALKITSEPYSIREVQPGIVSRVMIIGVLNRIAPRDENDAQKVASRGYKLKGPTQALNMFVGDDSDEMFVKIDRFDFEKLGRPVVERGRARKAIYAIKGTVPKDFRMIKVENIRYICDLDQEAS